MYSTYHFPIMLLFTALQAAMASLFVWLVTTFSDKVTKLANSAELKCDLVDLFDK